MRRKAPAVASTCSISARLSSSMVRKCLRCQGTGGDFRFLILDFRLDRIARGFVRIERDDNIFGFRGGHGEAGVVSRNGQPAAAAVDKDGQLDAGGRPWSKSSSREAFTVRPE
jgi:hypothetical protein